VGKRRLSDRVTLK